MLFRSRVSRVTRKDSLTTAEFRVDANIGVAIETAHRLFERRRIESDFRRQFGNRRCFDDIASPDPRLHREGRGLCHTQAVALYRERICDHPGTSDVFASHDRTEINIIQSFVDEAAAGYGVTLDRDRKSTTWTQVHHAHLVCSHLLEQKKPT